MNTFTLPDGRTLRTVGSWILVERIPVPTKTAGGIILSNPEREDATALGIVRAVGHLASKRSAEVPDVQLGMEPGMMCAFLWFYAERHTNQMVQQVIGENFVFLKWEDISLVWPADEPHAVSDIRSLGR